jgi:diguanylate cyclase (GGDEF)-like protein
LVVLVLIIGINSLALGYALAVWLGYGPTSGPVVELLQSLWPWDPPVVSSTEPVSAPQAVAAPAHVPLAPPPVETPLPPKPSAEESAPAKSVVAQESVVAAEPAGDDPSLEAAVFGLNEPVLRSAAQITEIDTRLRALQGQGDAATLQQCVVELLADCETFLARQREANGRFHQRVDELGPATHLTEQIELANLEQSAQTETVIAHLRQMDFQADPDVVAEHLLTEIHDLRAGRHRLRDAQEQVLAAIARHTGRLATIDASLATDPLTELPNRAGLEAALDAWWRADEVEASTLCAALVDLDGFGDLNRAYGSRAGDQVLRHLGQCLRQTAGPDGLMGRYAGQRFLLVARHVTPADLAARADQMRVEFEQTPCACGNLTIDATVSAVIAARNADETLAAFCQRLEQSLVEARGGGANHTVLCTPEGLLPVVPTPLVEV